MIKEALDNCLECRTKPCMQGCPLSNNITDIIKLMKEEKYKEYVHIQNNVRVVAQEGLNLPL